MGTYSSSQNTAVNNAPTVQDNTNPLTLTGSSRNLIDSVSLGQQARFASDNISLSGSAQLNTLDGGAISGAFDFADKSVAKLFDLTAKAIEQNSKNATDFLSQVKSANTDAMGLIDKVSDGAGNNINLLRNVLLGGAILGGIYLVLNYSKWGK